MAGLEPAIHAAGPTYLNVLLGLSVRQLGMDTRVTLAHDDPRKRPYHGDVTSVYLFTVDNRLVPSYIARTSLP